MAKAEIQILLATFNGANFLQEQLDSIYSQTFTDWQILVRDDGSTDNTLAIIQENIKKHPNKIELLLEGSGGNSSDNFMSLIQLSTSNYLALCDQDDVWEKNKLATCLSELKEIEKQNSCALVFTDMEIVDKNLGTIHSSFNESQALNMSWLNNTYKVFAQSLAAGCTMLFTRKLIKKLHPINSYLFQHDHWILMHAKQYGEVKFIPTISVKYRQHNQNSVGYKRLNKWYYGKKAFRCDILWLRWNYIQKVFGKEAKRRKIAFQKLALNTSRLLK